MDEAPWEDSDSGATWKKMEVAEDEKDKATSTKIPGDNYLSPPEAIPVPPSPSLSLQASSSPSLSVQLPAPHSSFDRNLAQPQALVVDRTPSSGLMWDRLHEICTQKGYRRQDAMEVLKTRHASAGAAEAKRILLGGNDMGRTDTPGVGH